MTIEQGETGMAGPAFMQSLREEVFSLLLRSVAVCAGILLLVGVFRLELGLTLELLISLVLLITCWVTYVVNRRIGYHIAVGVFLIGSLLAIALSQLFYRMAINPFLFYTPLVIGITGILLRPVYGFVMASAAALLLIVVTLLLGQGLQIFNQEFLSAVALGYLSAAVAWRSSQSFFSVVEWAMDSYYKVE